MVNGSVSLVDGHIDEIDMETKDENTLKEQGGENNVDE